MAKESNKVLFDFQSQWESLVTKGFSDFSTLSREERVWFTVQTLIGDVDNGGLISHYCNSGADFNSETIEDLNYLGFPDIAKLITDINGLFPDGKVPADIDERNDIVSEWDDEKFESYDKLFYEKENDIERTLVHHIQTKIVE